MLLYQPPRATPREKITEATIALNVSVRRGRRLEKARGAVDLTAECLLRFHRAITGNLGPALTSRPDSYARRQAVGIKALEVSDIAELMTIEGPHKAVARAAVRELLAPILDRFENEPPSGLLLGEAVADYARESADVGDAFMRGKNRGHILEELNEAEAKARVLRKVLRTSRGR